MDGFFRRIPLRSASCLCLVLVAVVAAAASSSTLRTTAQRQREQAFLRHHRQLEEENANQTESDPLLETVVRGSSDHDKVESSEETSFNNASSFENNNHKSPILSSDDDSDVVHYSLWFTPAGNNETDQFLSSFGVIAEQLWTYATFQPQMYIRSGKDKGCAGSFSPKCLEKCANGGLYCGDTYADVVESVYRMCIWKIYGEEDGIGAEWWNYVNQFHKQCRNNESYEDAMNVCRFKVYEEYDIDSSQVEACIAASGALQDTDELDLNTILDSLVNEYKDKNLETVPALVIEDDVYFNLSVPFVLQELCSQIESKISPEKDLPDVCVQCSSCIDPVNCAIQNGICSNVPPTTLATTKEKKTILANFTIKDIATANNGTAPPESSSSDDVVEELSSLDETPLASVNASSSSAVGDDNFENSSQSIYQSEDKQVDDPITSLEDDSISESSGEDDDDDSSTPLGSDSSDNDSSQDHVQSSAVSELIDIAESDEGCLKELQDWIHELDEELDEWKDMSLSELLLNAAENGDEFCSESKSIEFSAEMSDFTACTGINIREALHDLPDISFGIVMSCVDQLLTRSWNLEEERGSSCLDLIGGEGAFGGAIRALYLYPKKNFQCLDTLSSYTPDCVLDSVPQISGSWLKKVSCLLSRLSHDDYLETFCFHELEGLNMCLPDEGMGSTCQNSLDCPFIKDSLSLSLPSKLLGAPLPDYCDGVWEERKKSALGSTHVVDRYSQFIGDCATNSIWPSSKEMDQYDDEHSSTDEGDALINNRDDDDESSSQSPSGGDDSSFDNQLDHTKDNKNSLATTETEAFTLEEESSIVKRPAAMVLVGLLFFFAAGSCLLLRGGRRSRRNSWSRPEGYAVIELTS